MRSILESRKGQRLYLFTTFGAVYAAIVEQVQEDVVKLRGPDGKATYVNLADISSMREYDEEAP